MEKNELRNLPSLIRAKEEQMRQEEMKKEAYLLQLEKINAELSNSILNAKDEKEKPLYTNELSRKNAIMMYELNSPTYRTAKNKLKEVLNNIEKIKIELRFFHNQLKVEKIIAEMHYDN